MFELLAQFVRDLYHTDDFIPLHAPVFSKNEQAYVAKTIKSTFVSSVGAFVNRFEDDMARYTGSPQGVATVNGTAALHAALLLAGVKPGELVITQPLTFVATCNAIVYCGAQPVFLDVDKSTLGLSARAVSDWLQSQAFLDDEGLCRLRLDNRIIRVCLPMHTFGHPVDLDGLLGVCRAWNLVLVEDAAESLGSFYKERHTGTFGKLGTLSFNGNKIITTGGGGMILTDPVTGARAKHLTTTAKKPHPYEFVHDELGFNYRMPNINAALGCAQLEQLEHFVGVKRQLASKYADFFQDKGVEFIREPEYCRSNYWLNGIVCSDIRQRDAFLKEMNSQGIMTRPIWRLMSMLPQFEKCLRSDLSNATFLAERVVNLPSGVPPQVRQ